jgi:hypothetical protein
MVVMSLPYLPTIVGSRPCRDVGQQVAETLKRLVRAGGDDPGRAGIA